eukprot:Gb_31841 [translate_table: standard]
MMISEKETRAQAREANALVYSPTKLTEKYGHRCAMAFGQTLEIFLALGFFALYLLLNQINEVADWRKRSACEIQNSKKYSRGWVQPFVKAGQGLSSRPDLGSLEYLEENCSSLRKRSLAATPPSFLIISNGTKKLAGHLAEVVEEERRPFGEVGKQDDSRLLDRDRRKLAEAK